MLFEFDNVKFEFVEKKEFYKLLNKVKSDKNAFVKAENFQTFYANYSIFIKYKKNFFKINIFEDYNVDSYECVEYTKNLIFCKDIFEKTENVKFYFDKDDKQVIVRIAFIVNETHETFFISVKENESYEKDLC